MPMAKNYIKGSIRQVVTKQGESKIIASLSVDDLTKIANEKGFAQIVIQERREKDQYGNTHYAFENDWKPDANKATETSGGAVKGKVDPKLNPPKFEEEIDDLPF